MKFKIKNPFKILSEHFENNRREESIAQVNRDVQLREFEGKIWLCYDNVPIVEESQLKDTLCNTVASTREAACSYNKLEFFLSWRIAISHLNLMKNRQEN